MNELPAVVTDARHRCRWGDGPDAEYRAYHDREWGVPEHDERALFEKLLLDGFQAGLSWITILRKRRTSGGPSTGSTRRRSPATARRRSSRCSPIPGSCATGRRWRPRWATRGPTSTLTRTGSSSTICGASWGAKPIMNAYRTMAELPAQSPDIRGDEPRPRAPGVSVRGPHHLLRVHAVRGPRERPRDWLFPVVRGAGSRVTTEAGRNPAAGQRDARQASRSLICPPVWSTAPE